MKNSKHRDKRKKSKLRTIHLALALFWVCLIVPTILWWKESILWIAFMSLYAIVGTHVSAYQGARAEDSNNG